MDLEREPHEERILGVVAEILAPFVDQGQAAVRATPGDATRGALIEITPSLETACPLTIQVDAPGDLDLFVGRHELTTHIWEAREWNRGNPVPLETKLRDWLRAITDGGYEEEVRLTQDGATGKGRGTVQLAAGPHTFTYSNVGTLGERGDWQKVSYSPY